MKKGQERHCYYNAAVLALNRNDFTYVEGYADSMEHAWCVDLRAAVVDPIFYARLAQPEAYFGIAFDTAAWLGGQSFYRPKIWSG